jgi:predicted dithiol-disulfide oxidoreductase (DUF899 family)
MKTSHPTVSAHQVVSRDEWLRAREELLTKEKELSRLRDELSRQRRDLPWVKVDKRYVFDGPHGRQTLPELFAGRSQLIVYHFMFGPGWVEGCRGCSFLADHIDGTLVHLEHHDVSLHTYSAYARGGDLLLGTYNYLDLTPKGRNESGPMSWVRLHDTYDDSYAAATATVDEGR